MSTKKNRIQKKQTSQKQIEANRRNAMMSCGPKSPAGRAISSQNARKHQLLPFEDAASVAKIYAEYHGRFIPTTFGERLLVDMVAYADRVRRYCSALEAHIQAGDISEIIDPDAQSVTEILELLSGRLALVPQHRQQADWAERSALSQLEAVRPLAA